MHEGFTGESQWGLSEREEGGGPSACRKEEDTFHERKHT